MSALILVVDDEPDVEDLFRQQFRKDLRSSRFVMEFAQSASEALARVGARLADIVLGGDSEFQAAGLTPAAVLGLGARAAVAKHGPDGVSVFTRDGGEERVAGLTVPVVNGLGAGDAFGAAFGAGLLTAGGAENGIERQTVAAE